MPEGIEWHRFEKARGGPFFFKKYQFLSFGEGRMSRIREVLFYGGTFLIVWALRAFRPAAGL